MAAELTLKENNSYAQIVEQKTSKLYEDIHPYGNNEASIQNYLKTLGISESFFEGKDILDCGFGGTGWALELFSRSKAKSITGIDLNPRWRELHAEKLKNSSVPIRLITGNALDLPFADNTFDYVHSNGVLHHTVDWKKGVRELARVLKPGGTLFLMLYGKFAPVGTLIYYSYRLMGRLIPYRVASAVVKKTGFFRDPEISILDAMYAPIEKHLDEKEIRDVLNSCKLTGVTAFDSHKWRNNKVLSSPLLFGKAIHHNFWARKPETRP